MSLFYGIFDPNPANITDTLQEMYGGMAHLPHQKHTRLVKENVGFGHLLTYNTPEALYEQQPHDEPETQLLFVTEGRLDNREDLAQLLDVKLHPQLPDGELMQRAYLKWGKSSPNYLRGDWSFAVYDGREQELFLARDQHGYTAIYYYQDGDLLAFASSPKAIFALRGFEKKPDMRYFLGGLLIWGLEDKNRQSYENLKILPPAHTLTWKDGQIKTERYWFPENTPLRHYTNAQDYADELRAIFTKAVRVRLRSHAPVAAMLSGGIDSGSVASMAARLLHQQGQTLHTFSHVPLYKDTLSSGSSGILDETPYILATARHAPNITPYLLDSAHISPVEGFTKALDMYDSLFHAAGNAFWLVDLPTQVAQGGFGTLLSGEMGNASISYTGVDYLLPLAHPAFWRNPKKLAKRVAKPLALKYFNNVFNQRYKHGLLSYINDNYVREEVLAQWQVREDIKTNQKGFYRYYPDAKAGMMDILMVGFNPRCQFGNNQSNEFGIELRDPTGDVEVVEFCLSVPNNVFFDDQLNPKQLLKHTMHGILPDKVLHETRKGQQAADLLARLLHDRPCTHDLLHTLRASPTVRQWLDMEKMLKTWEEIQQNPQAQDSLKVQTFVKGLMYGYFLWKEN